MTGNRRRAAALALVLAVGLLWDVTRSPDRQITARALLGAIDVYQGTLSRAMPSLGVLCRFRPSCSRYAEAAIRRDGTLAGGWRSLVRLARCGPWTPLGTDDPP